MRRENDVKNNQAGGVDPLCGFCGLSDVYRIFGAISGIAQKSIHLTFVLAILFIGLYRQNETHKAAQVLDLFLLVARWRKVGPVLVIVVALFLFYAFFGKIFPLILRHGGMKFTRFIHLICYTSEGIFGSPLNSAATFICVFIILGALFAVTGVGDYITELASSVFGVFRGGPAKAAVAASALFGSISGSACANVIGTGTFTIPLMKRISYDGGFAGAVEATASTCGQIMPPIMGAAAFLVAEILQVRYWDVVKAAMIPAILFYVALLIAVDLYALSHAWWG